MGLFTNVITGSRSWCRPTHRTNCVAVTGANVCCVCIPSTATCFVVEMWGQGGGGAGGCCCMWNCVGGQGGDYGWFTCTTSGTNHILCVCVCQCYCKTPGATGMPGQFSRVTQCNAPSNIWCVLGGAGGCSSCYWMAEANCGTSYNGWERNKGHTSCAWNCCCFPLSSYTCANWCCDTCFVQTMFQGFGPFIRPPTGCACFNFYVRGACGWSDPNLMYCILGNSFNSYCGAGAGRGGAAYAGGQNQICDCAFGQYAYCGADGNFPGGGGSGSGACGGGCCCGSAGGDGLVLISWS